jgi:hypothetical protein
VGQWSAELRVRQAGSYTFACKSTDGSKVFVDDRLVLDNDGCGALHFLKTLNPHFLKP